MSRCVQVGLGVAVQRTLARGVPAIARDVQRLAGALRRELAELLGVHVHDRGRTLCGIVSFTVVRACRCPQALFPRCCHAVAQVWTLCACRRCAEPKTCYQIASQGCRRSAQCVRPRAAAHSSPLVR
jgi:selenocysteine lyase/cysteine desulfurase